MNETWGILRNYCCVCLDLLFYWNRKNQDHPWLFTGGHAHDPEEEVCGKSIGWYGGAMPQRGWECEFGSQIVWIVVLALSPTCWIYGKLLVCFCTSKMDNNIIYLISLLWVLTEIIHLEHWEGCLTFDQDPISKSPRLLGQRICTVSLLEGPCWNSFRLSNQSLTSLPTLSGIF